MPFARLPLVSFATADPANAIFHGTGHRQTTFVRETSKGVRAPTRTIRVHRGLFSLDRTSPSRNSFDKMENYQKLDKIGEGKQQSLPLPPPMGYVRLMCPHLPHPQHELTWTTLLRPQVLMASSTRHATSVTAGASWP